MKCALCNDRKKVWDKVYHNQLEEIDCPLCAQSTGSVSVTHTSLTLTNSDQPADASQRASASGTSKIIHPKNQ